MDHQQHDSKMMWLMMLACAAPIIFVSFAGSGTTSRIIWMVLGLGLMFLLHWVVMRWMHRGQQDKHAPPPTPDKTSDQPDHIDRPAH